MRRFCILTVALCACSFFHESQKATTAELHKTEQGETTKHEGPRRVVTVQLRPGAKVPPAIAQAWCGAHCEPTSAPDVASITIEDDGAVDTKTTTAAKTDASEHDEEHAKTKAAISPWEIAAVVFALLAVLVVGGHFALSHYLRT